MKNQMIQYNGYTALLTFDAEDNSFTGKVIGIEHSIVFEGATLAEATENFKDMMNRYPKLCSGLNIEPNQPNAEVLVPIQTELFAKAASIAENQGQTAKVMINQAIEKLVAQH